MFVLLVNIHGGFINLDSREAKPSLYIILGKTFLQRKKNTQKNQNIMNVLIWEILDAIFVRVSF